MLRAVYQWMGSKVYSKYATPALGALFFLEAIFFLPTDPMLIFYCIERRQKAIFYATVATIGSVIGGIASYFLGYILWQCAGEQIIHHPWVTYFVSPSSFKFLCLQYKKYECLAVLIAGFTPVPYKAATITAGFCKLSLFPFILCSIIARGARFYLYAFVIKMWGERMKQYIDRYLNIMALLIVVTIALIIWFLY